MGPGHDICPGEAVNPQTLPFKLFNLVGSKKPCSVSFLRPKTRKGFTLVELAVVIVIIGVLAAFGVPKFLTSVEKSKATEAFNYLSTVQSAQERYLAQNGVYCHHAVDVTLDIILPTLSISTTRPPSLLRRANWGPNVVAGTLTRNAYFELRLYCHMD